MESDDRERRSRAPVEQLDIDEIKLWLENQPHLPQNIDDDLIKSFLHSNYLNIERTKRTIETYYNVKTISPEFFNNRSMDDSGMQLVCQVVDMCILPKKSTKGYTVLVARLKDCNPDLFVLENAIKLLFMIIDSVLLSDPVPLGFIFVFDNEGTTIRHLLKVTVSILKKYITYLQEGIPVRMKQIHIINVNFIVTQVMSLIKPFLNGSHEIILHTQDRIDDMYRDVSQEILPEEYGGKSGSLKELTGNTYNELRKHAAWFQQDESFRIDENKRPKKKSDDFTGITGFLRKLSFT